MYIDFNSESLSLKLFILTGKYVCLDSSRAVQNYGTSSLKRGHFMDASKQIRVNFSMLRQARAKTNSIIFLKYAPLFIDKV